VHLIGFQYKNKKIFSCVCLSVASGCCGLVAYIYTVGITVMFEKDQNKNS